MFDCMYFGLNLFDNRCSVSGDLSEDGLSSNEDDGNSSDSSKEDMSQSKDKEVRTKQHHNNHMDYILRCLYDVLVEWQKSLRFYSKISFRDE